jgi:DNA-binding HxlR family transcriptional regulator
LHGHGFLDDWLAAWGFDRSRWFLSLTSARISLTWFPSDTEILWNQRQAAQEGTLKKPSHLKVPTRQRCITSFSDLPPEVCHSVSDVLARVGDKWSILVIAMLARGTLRFSELKRSLGSISQKVLTTTLRGLERDGYLTRKVTPTIPPRVDYELTELGRDSLGPVTALAEWAILTRKRVEAARAKFDRNEHAG